MARIDRLGAAKEIIQIAAVIGRGFSYELLREIAGKPEDALSAALDRVIEAELISVNGIASEATYLFKHVMVRDTAYGSLLKSRRRELHRAVARALSEKFAARAEAEPRSSRVSSDRGRRRAIALRWHGSAQPIDRPRAAPLPRPPVNIRAQSRF